MVSDRSSEAKLQLDTGEVRPDVDAMDEATPLPLPPPKVLLFKNRTLSITFFVFFLWKF